MSVFGLGDLAFVGAVTPVYEPTDPDAAAYITAVEAADGQPLESVVRRVIDEFVIGCKADGIWTAIKASCILAGARTLAGALVPLVGPAPTNVGPFVAGDYNRKTGLVGSTGKYLNSRLADNSIPQNSCHQAVFVSNPGSTSYLAPWIGVEENGLNLVTVLYATASGVYALNRRSGSGLGNVPYPVSNFFAGHNRATSTAISVRAGGTTTPVSATSVTPTSYDHFVFTKNRAGVAQSSCTSRLAFYSIGESLDLALLDARVTALINAFGTAIA